ncbi:M24 family metallopeptidase [Corynebacterium uterequi]|uniref:Xaa-Pro aminopeptidase n=1 Tax=Corynebacterium uterequi TaxID=1072256 RepID=A0A0G3HIU0_9CORY|nr:aminopeptidase P family protein [Corynebacterium uterequi]AKK11077.1 Xaa-Pro aminopeptidase [Corynebacterium uterequi]
MSIDYSARVARAQATLRDSGLAAVIIGTGAELAYFTGSWNTSHERLTCLVITPDSVTLVAPMVDIVGFAADVTKVGWADGEDPYRLVADRLPAGDVGLGSSLTALHVLALQALIDGETTPLPSGLFQVKEPFEAAELARAGAAIDAVHAQAPGLLQAGRTEKEVAEDLAELILREHTAVDFVIVGSGPNGANPHHEFSDRVLEPGDPVVVDIGGTLDSGYHSDSTRTYVVPGGEPPAEFVAAYQAVHAGYQAGIAAVAPGVLACDVDAAARGIIAEAGWGQYFTHRTGHGIGLSTHEEPFIIAGNELPLAEGMAFSIEPGVYVPGQWGVRIEDIVFVEAAGAKRLNLQPTTL